MNFKNLDADTAFNAGFAVRCAEEKLTQEEISARIKLASALLEKDAALPAWLAAAGKYLLGNLGQGALAGGKALVNPATYLAAAKGLGTVGLAGLATGGVAGGLGGAGLGFAAAKANEKDIDVEDIKAKEIQQTYDHYAQRMAARRAYEKERAKRLNQPV